MPDRSTVVLLALIAVCFAASYGLRFGLLEDGQWVGVCAEQSSRWECQLRALLGFLIYSGVIAWLGLGLALVAFFVPHRGGWLLAALAVLCAIAALILYSASLAVFAVVLAGLRLVRGPAATA